MIRPLVALASVAATSALGAAQCDLQLLAASDGQDGDQFGLAADLSGDTLVVGAPRHSDLGSASGAAYVFTRSGSTWSEVQEILAPDGAAADLFGWSVSIDGTTIAVSAWNDDDACVGDPTCNSGAVWVFEHDGTSFVPQAKLAAQQVAPGDGFGWTVVLDGDRLVANGGYDFPDEDGYLAIFERTGTTWTETAVLTQPFPFDDFGRYFDLDGDRIVVGDGNQTEVWVYERQGTAWVETAQWSTSVNQLSLSGDTLAIASLSATTGQVFLYRFDGASWVSEQTLVSGVTQDLFGSVALEGDRLVVGAAQDDENGPNAGAAHVFERSGGPGTWQQLAKLLPTDGGAQEEFGRAVALAGGVALFGARHALAGNQPGPGKAYVVDLDAMAPPPVVYCTAKTAAAGCVATVGTSGIASLTDPTPFVVSAANVPNGKNGLLFYGTNGPLAVPFLGGVLCVVPPLKRTAIQSSAGAPPCGGAYAFDFNAHVQSGGATLSLGDVWAQYWFRDPQHPDGTGTALSDAVAFTVCF